MPMILIGSNPSKGEKINWWTTKRPTFPFLRRNAFEDVQRVIDTGALNMMKSFLNYLHMLK